MARLAIGTTPKQVLPPNTGRIGWEVQFLPSSIIAGNTGNVFLAVNNPPGNSVEGEVYDELLNAGASVTRRLADGDSPELVHAAVWLQSDGTDQIVLVKEIIGTPE
jgi:hypothetical protein